jgi:TPR repeat protein
MVEAVRWYKLAAEQGYTDAQFNLGVIFSNGQGVAQDYVEAARWYKLAAAQGNVRAQNNLATRYEKGQGVEKSNLKSFMWYNLAAVGGYADAVKNREIVAAKMTPQQISEAQKLARECQARNFKNCD